MRGQIKPKERLCRGGRSEQNRGERLLPMGSLPSLSRARTRDIRHNQKESRGMQTESERKKKRTGFTWGGGETPKFYGKVILDPDGRLLT